MAGSMKDIKLRIKSVESTMQITKAMELVASSKMRRAKERVEHSRPYFETLHDTLTGIAAADPRARSPYLRRAEIKRTLLVVIAGDRGLAGGYNSNVLKQAEAQQGPVTVLPIGRDIVCAGASALVCALAGALDALGAQGVQRALCAGHAAIAADDRADVRAAFTVAVTGLRQLAAAYPGHVAEDTGRVPAQETKPNGSAAAGRCPGAVPGSGQQRKKET